MLYVSCMKEYKHALGKGETDRGREGGMALHIYEWGQRRTRQAQGGLEEMPGLA